MATGVEELSCVSKPRTKKASAGYDVGRSGPARNKYPCDGLEIFWNHTNIYRKLRIEAL